MTPHEQEYICLNEERLREHELRLEKLDSITEHKDEKINQVIVANQKMDEKLDKITETLHKLELESARDDYNIDTRVTSLESTVRTIKYLLGVGLTGLAIIISILSLFSTHW